MSSVFDDPYRDAAIDRGRPVESCDCDDCDCELHTYPSDDRCVWCRNGDHAADDVDNLATAQDGPSTCFECGADIDPDEAMRASPDHLDGDVLLCDESFDRVLSAMMDGEDVADILGGGDHGE